MIPFFRLSQNGRGGSGYYVSIRSHFVEGGWRATVAYAYAYGFESVPILLFGGRIMAGHLVTYYVVFDGEKSVLCCVIRIYMSRVGNNVFSKVYSGACSSARS